MDWPVTLPNPVADGFGLVPDSGLARTPMESGDAKQRVCYSDGPDTITVAWRFTLAEMATFREFFRTDLALGSAWFTVTILDGTSAVAVARAARFVGDVRTPPFKAKLLSKAAWEVTASLEIRSA